MTDMGVLTRFLTALISYVTATSDEQWWQSSSEALAALPTECDLPRIDGSTAEGIQDFEQNYLSNARPVILTNVLNISPAMQL